MKHLACVALALPIALVAQNGATLEGTVSDVVTHAGVAGVAVTFSTQKGVTYKAVTDSSGKFRIADVQPGEYRQRYEKSGFDTLELPHFGETGIRVAIGGSHHLDIELPRLATLRGRVLDPDGKPAAGVNVQAGPHGADTDSEGRFVLTNLRPGMYTVHALGGAPTRKSDHEPRTQIIETYFPSAVNPADAERIEVRAGADLAGIDIHQQKSAVFRIAGTVLDENGKPYRAATVLLLKPSKGRMLAGVEMRAGVQTYVNFSGPESTSLTAETGSDGRFEFPAITPGEWLVQARLDPQHDAANHLYFPASGVAPARVSDHDLDNIRLQFEPTFPLDVTPDWGDNKPPAGTALGAVRLFRTDSTGVAPIGSTTDGVTRFDHVAPGQYRIVPGMGGPAGFYAAAVLVDGRDMSGQDVQLTASSKVSIVYKPNSGTVRGTVAQGEGAHVLLWPQQAGMPYVIPTVTAGANGEFEFQSVPPGSYAVIAFDRIGPQGATPDYMLQLIANAAQVRVQELSTESVTVPLTQWLDR